MRGVGLERVFIETSIFRNHGSELAPSFTYLGLGRTLMGHGKEIVLLLDNHRSGYGDR